MDEKTLEAIAKSIYPLLPAAQDGTAEKYPWVDGGNSDMQYLARQMAREALNAIKADQPRVCGYMRRWAFDGVVPFKVKGRWEKRFRILPVTERQCFPDDVALVPDIR